MGYSGRPVDEQHQGDDSDSAAKADLLQVLGYLNFSSGKIDSQTLSALNRVYSRALPGGPYEGMPAWLQMQQWLQDALVDVSESQSAFSDASQATHLIELVWLQLLPAYLDFHRDLLFHQEPEGVFNGFFLGYAMEACVIQGGPWTDVERIVAGAITHLNDFVGHRPVAVLEGRSLEPYAHEWVRPIPLYLPGIGAATGPYAPVVTECIRILEQTDPTILRQACFDLSMLDELSLDPRAYDFDHPVNQRPNYHFGQWDPHRIDNSGNYRRFVIQQVTLDALLARCDEVGKAPREEILFEAAAVLAGTILMASGISGPGPGYFASTVTLADLLGPIAKYRDEFYEQLLLQLTGKHAERLRAEQKVRRQPLGGARQHLNTHLAKRRASQLEHVQLARLFARMGHAAAAKEQSDFVPVPSARIISRIDCMMTEADHRLQNGELDEAVAIAPKVVDLVHRGIHCGAIVDPWNILGFAGNFSRFDGADSPVHDHRVEDLVQLMEYIFALQSRIWREAAAAGRDELCEQIESQLRSVSKWWRKFAAHEVSDVEATDSKETVESAVLVAKALRLWHTGGAETGDLKFWAPHLEMFDSPKAYALVVEALLERNDFVAAMALLVHWLSNAETVGLQKGEASFSDLARRWMQQLEHVLQSNEKKPLADNAPAPTADNAKVNVDWSVAKKFFDYVEANAGEFWEPPKFALSANGRQRGKNLAESLDDDFDFADPDDEENLFDAAYEDVVYNDTTDDGVDSDTPEEGNETEAAAELQSESNRLNQHLTFLTAMAQMWKGIALSRTLRQELQSDACSADLRASRLDAIGAWAANAANNRKGLLQLLEDVAQFKIKQRGTDHDSMSRYDRERLVKESLIERIIATAVETADARRLLLASLSLHENLNETAQSELKSLPEDDRLAVQILGGLLSGENGIVDQSFPRLLAALRSKKLLYIPLARGGDPAQIYSVRLRRRILSHLLMWLPRQGFYSQACELIETARFMEHHNPIGPGAVTEFDDLFKLCFVSMVRSVVQNSLGWRLNELSAKGDRKDLMSVDLDQHDGESLGDFEPVSEELISILEMITEVMLGSWLSHSRTLRLSVLETVDNARNWDLLVDFIKRFGEPLFTQSFLRLVNVRAILHQGVDTWLDSVEEDGSMTELEPLFEAIESGELTRKHASKMLSVVLEAVIDHYSEYRDYNSTTTQSDRGELLYMLLDFLRLRVRYDRVSWNLKPIYWTHEVLVRGGCHQTAQQWRRALADRIGRESELYLEQLIDLQNKYAMRMPTVADRLRERFTRPMTVDRMRVLVGPAVRQLRSLGPSESIIFDLLIDECKLMMEQPTGVGLDVPQWLEALESEVDNVLESQRGFFQKPKYDAAVGFQQISSEAIVKQLEHASQAMRRLNISNE